MELSVYLAHQPIFDRHGQVFAYELLYRDTHDNAAHVSNHLHATARVLVNTLNYVGLQTLTNGRIAFIKVDDTVIMDKIVLTVPPRSFVLEILESSRINDALVERIAELHAKGYRFALNHYTPGTDCTDFMARVTSLLPYIDYVKIDIAALNAPEQTLSKLKTHRLTFIAEKIEDEAALKKAETYGFDYFQGYYFCAPDLLKKENFDPDASLLLDLIYLLKTNSPLEEILSKFNTSPYLTINLLKLIKQNEEIPQDAVSSVEQALLLLGRKRLSCWLELMFYADGENGTPEENAKTKEVTSQALQRAYLMEELAYTLKQSVHFADVAYMTGILSSARLMFEGDYEELLAQMKVDKTISEALLHGKGELGRLLELAIAVEKNDLPRIGNLILQLDLSDRELNTCLLNSYHRSCMRP